MSYSLAFSQAIAMVVYIAIKVEHEIYDFVPTRELAENLNIANPSAVKILQNLSRAGIIETREGAKGGVRLGGAPDKLTLLDIFTAIEHERPLFRIDPGMRVENEEAQQIVQRVLDIFSESEQAMKGRLHEVTVAALYR
jgi:Rrf2 family protein